MFTIEYGCINALGFVTTIIIMIIILIIIMGHFRVSVLIPKEIVFCFALKAF